jgi:hypothetical protein
MFCATIHDQCHALLPALFFEIGASAIFFKDRCSEGTVTSNQVLRQAALAELIQLCNRFSYPTMIFVTNDE